MLDEPRWLVLNKLDLLPREDAEEICRDIVERMNWQGPVYEISAISGDGTRELIFDIMNYLEENDEDAATAG
jgi:GTP-binding protein